MKKHNSTVAYISILLLEVFISGYLLFRQFSLIASSQSKDICQTLALGNCDDILQSNELIWGLPWSAWGVLYFSGLLIILGLARLFPDDFTKGAGLMSLLLTFSGSIISLVLLSEIIWGNHPFCGLCVVTHLLQLCLAYIIWKVYENSFSEILMALQNISKFLFLGKSSDPSRSRLQLVIILMLGFAFIALYQRLNFEIKIQRYYSQLNLLSDNTTDNFFVRPVVEIPISKADASIGKSDAAIQIVIFSDFECPYCAEFAKVCQELVNEYPDDLRLIFKHYPLSSACNSMMEENMHPRACEMAKTAQAALLQGKFWQVHDLFFIDGFDEENLNQHFKRLKLNLDKLERDRQSPHIEKKIQADIALANNLGIMGTPSVFINNRKVENVHPEVIQTIIERVLQNPN